MLIKTFCNGLNALTFVFHCELLLYFHVVLMFCFVEGVVVDLTIANVNIVAVIVLFCKYIMPLKHNATHNVGP